MKDQSNICLFLALIITVNCLPKDKNGCLQSLNTNYKELIRIFGDTSYNVAIDDFTKIVLDFPTVLDTCGQDQLANQFRKQLPAKCVNDLDKAAKILIRMMNESDNEIKFARDSTLLEILFKTKLQKECPFLSDVKPTDFKAGGMCFQSVYKLSLVFQNAFNDLKAGNKQLAISQFSDGLEALPKTLETCGLWNLAQTIRKDFPPECVKAFDEFSVQMSQVLHNYMHAEWLAKHYKEIIASYANLQKACPIVNHLIK